MRFHNWFAARQRLTIAVVAIFCAGAAVAGCGSSSSAGHPASNHGTRAAKRPVDSSSSISFAVLGVLFPRDAADDMAGRQFEEFEESVLEKADSKCLANDGLPGAPGQFPDVGLSDEFPDLAQVARTDSTGFETPYPTPYDPTKGMSKSEKQAYEAALGKCQAAVNKSPVASFLNKPSINLLRNEWGNVLLSVDDSPTVLRADKSAASCSAHSGFPLYPRGDQYLAAMYDAIENHERPLIEKGQTAALKIEDQHAARVLVKCFTQLETLRDKLRADRRRVFFEQNATAIRKIQDDAESIVAGVERGTGARL